MQLFQKALRCIVQNSYDTQGKEVFKIQTPQAFELKSIYKLFIK